MLEGLKKPTVTISEYDSYEWDAELLVGTAGTQLTLSVAADGSWTLE